MDRREMLTSGAAALAALAMANTALAADANSHEHHHEMGPQTAGLAAAAGDCIQTGQLCVDHCLVLLSEGDKAMAACAQSVTQMLSVCGTLQRLANAKSKFLPQMAKLAFDVCRDCEAECKKHAEKHAECKACMDSCGSCAKECQKFAA